jgi:hypothetical protein
MIREAVKEVVDTTGERITLYGLRPQHFADATRLAENSLILEFRDMIIKGQAKDLLDVLKIESKGQKVGFIRRKILYFKRLSLRQSVCKRYQKELEVCLLLSSASALLTADMVMLGAMAHIGHLISASNNDEESLITLIDDAFRVLPAVKVTREQTFTSNSTLELPR